ncbi:START domain-containing protein [Thermodesulfobacteriota bacterium]
MKLGHIFLSYMLIFLLLPINSPAMTDLPVQSCLFEDEWNKLFSKKGITVYSQTTSYSNILAFKAAGILKAPIEQVMEVLRKVEISEQWMPDIKQKITVKEVSDLEAITYSVNKMPWPFADREMLLRNKLRLDREKKYLVVDVYSVDYNAYPVNKKNVRAHIHCGQTLIRPAGRVKTEVELIIFLDPKGYIPTWLANIAQKSLPYNFLRALEEKASTTNFELRPTFQKMLNDLIALP